MNQVRSLGLFCCILTLLVLARISLGDVLATAEWLAVDGLQRTHLPHARAASSACEYAFADSRQLAAAQASGTPLATNDLQLYKRARDLGKPVEFVDLFPGPGGTPSEAASKATNYVPQPI